MTMTKSFLVLTDGMSSVINGANTGQSAMEGNTGGIVLGAAQTAQGLCSVARIGGGLISGAAVPLNVWSLGESIKNISDSIKYGEAINQSDIAGAIGGASGLGTFAAIVIISASGWVVIPLAVISIGAGAWQFMASTNGWTFGEGRRPLTEAEIAEANNRIKESLTLPLTGNYLKELMLPPLAMTSECDCKVPKQDQESHNKWREAVEFRPRDPLAIDIDLDGIETIAINPQAPILFDHNGDGDPSATGWLKGDDGWLVNDLDGDGKITSGKELLGVDTDITVGSVTRKATTGFEALRALDTHQEGDGKDLFDSRDAAFTQLHVWQDKNQNGVTDDGELSTLDALGIVGIQLQETVINKDLGGGNSITGKALVTRRVAGSTSTSEVDSVLVTNDSAANLNLADNPFYTDLEDVTVTEGARALPNMQGSGLVYSLREAMSLGTQASATLTATVQAFASANTRDAQMSLIDKLITEWGATSTLSTSGNPLTGTWLTTSIAPNSSLSTTTQQRIKTFAEQNPEMYRKVIVLEQFNGQMGLSTLMARWNVALPTTVTNSLNAAYSALRDSVYAALVVQTRIRPYLESIDLVVDQQGLRFDLTDLTALIGSTKSSDISKAIIDVLELNQFAGSTLRSVNFDGESALRSLLASAPSNLPLLAQLPALGLFQAGATSGTGNNDVYLGNQSNNSFDGGLGDDQINGDAGDDVLQGGADNDVLHGDSGNDTLAGGRYDTWNGNYNGAGNDTYLFGVGDGQDVIIDDDATVGNLDRIEFKAGVASSSVRAVRSGDALLLKIAGTSDQIKIDSYFVNDARNNRVIEEIRFTDEPGTHWTVADVKAKTLQGSSANDTLIGYASADSFDAGDGADLLQGRDGNDTLSGGIGNDNVQGDNGNDALNGDAGDDVLHGGADNDVLHGGSGNDTLAGGRYDTWNGNYNGAGNDTYLFGVGDGQDVIIDDDATLGNTDVLSFINVKSTGITSVTRNAANGLVVRYGASDSVTVKNFFASSNYRIELLTFSDGVTWSSAAIDAITSSGLIALPAGSNTWTGQDTADFVFGSTSSDSMSGRGGDDWLHGHAGGDVLRGGEGRDSLVGGLGSDVLYGDVGADTYVYAMGDGYDAIYGQRAEDTLIMKGFRSTDVTFNRTFSDINIAQTSSGTSYNIVSLVRQAFDATHEFTGVSQIVFDDKAITADEIRKLALQGTSSNDSNLRGYASNDTINGGLGDDKLYGEGGDDKLYGGLGNDLLDGGTGNDYLDGGAGSDTYLFSRGGGQDTIYDADSSLGVTDILQFQTGIAHDQLWFSQSGTHLTISVIGTSDSVKIAGGAGSATFRIEQLTAGGKTLSHTQVANLVQAMATMTPPAMGQTTLSAAQQAQLAPVLAANWS